MPLSATGWEYRLVSADGAIHQMLDAETYYVTALSKLDEKQIRRLMAEC